MGSFPGWELGSCMIVSPLLPWGFELGLLGFHLMTAIFSAESFSSRDLMLLVTSLYRSQYQEWFLWASSMALSSMQVTTCGHTVQNVSSIWWNGIATVGLFTAVIACVAYISQVVHSSLWVVVTNLWIPWIFQVCSCSLSLNKFEAPFSWEDLWSSEISISGHCGNRSVMWSHLMEVV